jgi:uncharacterized damage-inducible protein DinB
VSGIPRPERFATLKVGSEHEQLESWLDFYRQTLVIKCAGLSDDDLRRPAIAQSSLTLLGLLRHMAAVEWWWFENGFAGVEGPELIATTDDPDADFNDLTMTGADALAMFEDAVARAKRSACAPLDQLGVRVERQPYNLRWVYVHMIEEYARHCGHADFLREAIDGATGY